GRVSGMGGGGVVGDGVVQVDERSEERLHDPPRQTVTACGDRCRHIVTAGGVRGRRTPRGVAPYSSHGTVLVVGTEVVEHIWRGKWEGMHSKRPPRRPCESTPFNAPPS